MEMTVSSRFQHSKVERENMSINDTRDYLVKINEMSHSNNTFMKIHFGFKPRQSMDNYMILYLLTCIVVNMLG